MTRTDESEIEVRRGRRGARTRWRPVVEYLEVRLTPSTIIGLAYESPVMAGQPITLKAYVYASDPGGSPTGQVSFYDGDALLGTSSLQLSSPSPPNTDAASLTIPYPADGYHAFRAVYAGDANYTGSTSDPLGLTVIRATTTTTLSSSVPAVAGQPITFTAYVDASFPRVGDPTGPVSFYDGDNLLGTSSLSLHTPPPPFHTGTYNAATLTVSSLSAGQHSIHAVYGGSIGFYGSTSGAINQTINPAPIVHPMPTTTTLLVSPSTSLIGQSVTFTATVKTSGPPVVFNGVNQGVFIPSVTVSFFDGATLLGTAPLIQSGTDPSGSVATFTTTALGIGHHAITAVYSGFSLGNIAYYASSTSASIDETVVAAGSTVTVASSDPNAAVGRPVTYTATISPIAPATADPTGFVFFFDGATLLGAGTVSGRKATFTATAALAGISHEIRVVYLGDTRLFGSTSSPLVQTVSKANASLIVVAQASIRGVRFPTAVVVASRGAPAATGTITVTDKRGRVLGSAKLVGGLATVSVTRRRYAKGTTFTVRYSGDANTSSAVVGPVTATKATSPVQPLKAGHTTHASSKGVR